MGYHITIIGCVVENWKMFLVGQGDAEPSHLAGKEQLRPNAEGATAMGRGTQSWFTIRSQKFHWI